MSECVGVGFDIDHTLAIDNKLERVTFLHVLQTILDDGGHVLGNLAQESDRIDTLLGQQRSGLFSIDDAVRIFARERGVPPRERYVEQFRRLAVAMVDDFVIPLPGVREVFARLRERGIAMAVLSNGWNPLQVRKAQRAGFEGPVLASGDLGVQKPAAGAFAALLDVLGTPRECTWYVGDDPLVDVAGARDSGLHQIWLDAQDRPYPADLHSPTSVVHSMEELPCVLGDRSPTSS